MPPATRILARGPSLRHRSGQTSQVGGVTKQSLVAWDGGSESPRWTDSHHPMLCRLPFPFLLLWIGDPCMRLGPHAPRGKGCTATPFLQLPSCTSCLALSMSPPVPSPCSPLTVFQMSYTSIGFSSPMLCSLVTSMVWCWEQTHRASCCSAAILASPVKIYLIS